MQKPINIISQKIPNTHEYAIINHRFGQTKEGYYGIVVLIDHEELLNQLTEVVRNTNKFNFMWKDENTTDLCVLFSSFHLRIYNIHKDIIDATKNNIAVILELIGPNDKHLTGIRIS